MHEIKGCDIEKDSNSLLTFICEREFQIRHVWEYQHEILKNKQYQFTAIMKMNGEKICFGKPISFDMWIRGVKDGIIYYDGYSTINGRWRGVFRAKNDYWHSLINEVYE